MITVPCFGGGNSQNSVKSGPNPNMNLTGLPIVKQKETYTFAYQRNNLSQNSMTDKEAVKRAERETNIQINWMEIPVAGWTERLNILFASSDLPDAIIRPVQDIMMQNLSQMADLTDLIDPYSPILSEFLNTRPDVRSMITAPDGRIYSFPGGVENLWSKTNDCLFINKTWLDALKLPVPSTTEEFYNTLKAFRDNDMNGNGNRNDEIPFSFCQANDPSSMKSMFGSFGILDNPEHLQVINGVVTFTPARPEFLEALRYFNKLYSENLIDPEAFSQSYQQYLAKGKESRMLYGSFIVNIHTDVCGGDRINDYIPVAPLKGPSGIQLWNRFRGAGLALTSFTITNKCRNPETLVRWYDYLHSSFEILMLWQLGPENYAWDRDSAGRWRNSMINVPQGSSFQEYWYTMSVGSTGPQCPQIFDFNNVNTRSLEGDDNTIGKLASQALQEAFLSDVLPQGLEDPVVIQDRAIMFADIDTYIRNFIATSVMQGVTDAQWNEHLRNTERMNIPRYVQSYQALYDRSR